MSNSLTNDLNITDYRGMETVDASNMYEVKVVSVEEQNEADKTIRDMIQELVEVMYSPVYISENRETRSVGTQAGYSCTECQSVYSSNGNLQRHVRAIHEAHVYLCQFCGLCYVRHFNLRKHMLKIHHVTTS